MAQDTSLTAAASNQYCSNIPPADIEATYYTQHPRPAAG